MNTWQEWALGISSGLAGLAWTMFVIWYWVRATWWKSQIGQNVMILAIIIAFTFDRLAYFIWTPPFSPITSNQAISGIITYMSIAVVGVQRTYLMETSQRHPVEHNRRKDDPK